jgi:ribosomal protein L3
MEKKMITGRKLNMSQVFADSGRVTPVTLIKLEKLPADLLPGTPVEVTGVSKGKGFAGVMKRWGFAGGYATHGQSNRERAPGSIGGTTTIGRVYRGKKMAGHTGCNRITVRGLSVVEIDVEGKTVAVSGAVPGPRRAELRLRYEPQEVASGPSEEKEVQEDAEVKSAPVPDGGKETKGDSKKAKEGESRDPEKSDKEKSGSKGGGKAAN